MYFRHSHQRGPKPYPTPVITTTQRDPPFPPTHTSNPDQSSLSFKLGPSSLARSRNDNEQPVGDASTSSFAPLPSPPEVNPLTSGSGYIGAALNLADNPSLFAMEVDQEQKRSATPQTATPVIITTPPPDFPTVRTDSLGHTRNSNSPGATGPGPSKHYNMTQRHTQTHSIPSPPLDTYGFSTSNLTYDSFWSTHSTSTFTGNVQADVPGEMSGTQDGHRGQALQPARRGSRRNNGGRTTAGREG